MCCVLDEEAFGTIKERLIRNKSYSVSFYKKMDSNVSSIGERVSNGPSSR